jgi:putative membrane protein
MDMLFQKIYSGLFHFVVGIVIASTVMIVPIRYNYLSAGTGACVLAALAGAGLGLWMSRLEKRYKPS